MYLVYQDKLNIDGDTLPSPFSFIMTAKKKRTLKIENLSLEVRVIKTGFEKTKFL